MCGIVGCMLKDKKDVAPILFECIRKLECRGYDSVGISTYSDKLYIKKDKGNIDSVDKKLDLKDMPGYYGIAHVRWASVGKATKLNSHPHVNEEKSVAIVHNGTIKNYTELKKDLISEGHKFQSQTDTEVIAHLIGKFMKEGLDLEHALRKSTEMLNGSYAIVAISSNEPDKMVGTRKDSPLVVGIEDDAYYLASDIPAMIQYTRNVVELEEGEIVVISNDNLEIHDEFDNVVHKDCKYIDWSPEMVEKQGYPYYMLKEIFEQPESIKKTLTQKETISKIIEDIGKIERICFIACGTSYHAALSGKYIIESTAKIPTNVVLASEFRHSLNSIDDKTLVICVSQSGETADTLLALNLIDKNIKTLSIVNVETSQMTKITDYSIITQAGPEIGVAATKTYISQICVMYLLAATLGEDEKLIDRLYKVPDYIEEILEQYDEIEVLSKKYAFANDLFYMGKGFSYPTALEAALKMKEISYIHAEAYASGELKHGPLALIDFKMPVITIIPPGEDHDLALNSLQEVKARKTSILALGSEIDETIEDKANDTFLINSEVDEIIAPLVYIVPLQLIAYFITLEKQHNPDRPRNLAKTVTTPS